MLEEWQQMEGAQRNSSELQLDTTNFQEKGSGGGIVRIPERRIAFA
jgi:hypothetical protein